MDVQVYTDLFRSQYRPDRVLRVPSDPWLPWYGRNDLLRPTYDSPSGPKVPSVPQFLIVPTPELSYPVGTECSPFLIVPVLWDVCYGGRVEVLLKSEPFRGTVTRAGVVSGFPSTGPAGSGRTVGMVYSH